MKELVREYSIDDNFLDRYFLQNAKSVYFNNLYKKIWFNEGEFIKPVDKNKYISNYIKDEIKEFYIHNKINIPYLEYFITSSCTLNCKDCCALVPFSKSKSFETFENIKKNIDKLLQQVSKIRKLVLIGGEPLLNKELAKIVEYLLQNEKIELVSVTTNCTLVPDVQLVEVLKKYRNKFYFNLSDYRLNENLKDVLKNDEIEKLLRTNGIKFLINNKDFWYEEKGIFGKNIINSNVKQNFLNCYRKHLVQIRNDKFSVCSKASVISDENNLNNVLLKSDDIRKSLIEFYSKDFFEECLYCNFSDKKVLPAVQN